MANRGLFRTLLKMSVGSVSTFGETLSSEDWEQLFAEAARHAILGVTFLAIDELQNDRRPPLSTYSKWALVREKIGSAYESRVKASAKLTRLFGENGRSSCILKGVCFASYYPVPDSRQSGDVDIWVEGDYRSTIDFLRGKFPLHDVVYHHCSVRVFKDIPVEVHFVPSWFFNPLYNRRFRKYVGVNAPACFSVSPDVGYAVPPTSFNLVYAIVHLFRHVLSEGAGLRQAMDCYHLLRAATPYDREKAFMVLRSFGLGRFTAALMYVLSDFFDLGDEYLLCSPEKRTGVFLEKDILKAGNFGRGDERNRYSSTGSLPVRIAARASRSFTVLRLAPSEIVFAPIFRLWQFLWRKRNGFLD